MVFRRRTPNASASPSAPSTGAATTAEPGSAGSVLDHYVKAPPSDQQALDVFAGQWSSAFPEAMGLAAGAVPLFEDPRIAWTIEQMGGVDDLHILELGPLEGGHSSMLHAAGASVTAIESNTRAFLKCLIVKNILDLHRCRFELGDFLPFLSQTDRRFDLVLASGVLYHSPDPVALIESIGRVTDRVAIWTHYFEPGLMGSERFARVFAPFGDSVEWRGRTIGLRRRAYLETLDWSGFCGGSEESALWIDKESLFGMLAELGFTDVRVQFDDPEHPYGPCLMLFASR